ncbi:methionyl-tRNA formyltransferase [Patescibacteria group bacterium]|nr:methionyl-tRNA formyltransferase [Patescibacteria group bacterium]
MKNIKVIFFGTSDRSTPILESLKSNFNLVLCITKKDTKIGRKQISKETEVKRWAKENNIPFLEIDSLKNDNLEQVINKIGEIKPDYGIVADFGFIIPKTIIDSLNDQIINIHFSLLPKYRGASPVQFSILNGDDITGITYYLLDENMDTGNIISQIEYKIDTRISSGELYDILFTIAAENLPDILKKYSENEITPQKQDEFKATYTFSQTNPKHTYIFKEDALINWDEKPEKIERMVRAFNPWPIAWSYLKDLENANCLAEKIILKGHVDKDLKIKIFKSHIENEKLQIDEIQVEGKNKMSWDDFRNGYLEKI